MKYTYSLCIILFAVFFCACKNNKPTEKANSEISFESAMPHSESLPETQLSETDKQKLANAKGKSALPISMTGLDSMFNISQDKLHVFGFFSLGNEASKSTMEALVDLQKEVGESSMKLVLVNLGEMENLKNLNSFIRENEVTSEVYFTSKKLNNDWFQKVNNNWSGKVPAIFLLNRSDGTNIFYQKKFNQEELKVLMSSLMM